MSTDTHLFSHSTNTFQDPTWGTVLCPGDEKIHPIHSRTQGAPNLVGR
jgi:hypothetical protein